MTDKIARIIQWRHSVDRGVALAGIDGKAQFIRDDAEGLAHYVDMLESLPEYDTIAEEAVANAELALTEALFAVKVSKLKLERKRCPVTPIAAE